MDIASKKLREQPWFEKVYKVGITIKGIDGLVELVAGIGILISPMLIHRALSAIIWHTNNHHGGVFRFIAVNVAGVDKQLVTGGLLFLSIFLIVHGLIKIALVYCLLREITRAYPVALAILGVFLIYQLYVLITDFGIGILLLTILDIIIVWLVWGEYQDLRAKKVEK
jgi:uncharacterized membrane protein